MFRASFLGLLLPHDPLGQALLSRHQPALDAAAAELAAGDGGGAEHEEEQQRRAAHGDVGGEARRRLPGDGLDGEEPALLLLHLLEDGPQVVHGVLAPVALDDHDGALELARLAQLHRLAKLRQLLAHELREHGEPLLLGRVIAQQQPDALELTGQHGDRARVGLQVALLPRQEVAALARLRVLDGGEQRPQLLNHLLGMSHLLGAVRPALQRAVGEHRDGHDGHDRDREPPERHRGKHLRVRPGRPRGGGGRGAHGILPA